MLKILDLNDNALEVEVVRYFRLNSKNYFMYTLNEADEQNYLKLYALKVTENLQGEKIVDDAEWAVIKDEIKVIIKGNKEGNLVIEDLNFEELKNFKISETRAFKLSAQLVDLLKANKKEFPIAPAFDVAVAMNEMTVEPVEAAFDMTLPVEEPVMPVVEPVIAPAVDPIASMFEPTLIPEEPVVEPVIEPVVEVAPIVEPVVAPIEEPVVVPFIEPTVEPVVAPIEEPIVVPVVEPVKVEMTPIEVAPVAVDDFAMPAEQFVADYSFETEDDEPVIAPIVVNTIEEKPEVEIEASIDNDYKLLYEEEKALTEVLKNEISELREKLNKITQVLSN